MRGGAGPGAPGPDFWAAARQPHIFAPPSGANGLPLPQLARQPAPRTLLRAKVTGKYGVLEETPSPLVESEEPDELFDQLVAIVQAADQKRGVDIVAFWINGGFDIIVIITALSRPQLAAIAEAINIKCRKELRLKRMFSQPMSGSIREQAASGWCLLRWPRVQVNIMTPVQRQYYDIEGNWKDNKDYEPIPLEDMLREDGFGAMRLTRELGGSVDVSTPKDATGEFMEEDIEFDENGQYKDEVDYEEDEDDPFWS